MTTSGGLARRALMALLALAGLGAAAPVPAGEMIGREALVPLDSRTAYSIVVNRAPPDGAKADVNPPRFRWYYIPDVRSLGDRTRVLYRFRFQITDKPDFAKPLVDVETDYNFFNELAPLDEGKTYYWRVGYLCQMACWDGRNLTAPAERAPGIWSPVHTFTIAPGTPKWDRSILRDPPFGEHPRMLFRKGQLGRLRELVRTDPRSKSIFEKDILFRANQVIRHKCWNNWPDSDTGDEVKGYYGVTRSLLCAAFAYKVTGDAKYRNAPAIFARIATYPKGGRSSPEGMGGDDVEDSTSLTEFLALAYDWFYDEYSPEQRAAFEKSLEWRIDAWMHEFRWGGSWYTRLQRGGYDGPSVSPVCLQLSSGDHQWEGTMATFPAAMAIYEKSAVARNFFHHVANYLIGVGERAAQNGCPDQGLNYGQSHLKWLMFQTIYLASALPGLELQKNPFYQQVGDYYTASAPIGLPGAPWGRGDANGGFWAHRAESFRLLACFTGNGVFMQNWVHAGGKDSYWYRPWVHAAAPLLLKEPLRGTTGDRTDFFFPADGWVMSHQYPPTELKAFREGTGVVFACRPSHRQNAFFNNNAFQFYAYGQSLNWGGGGAEDPLPFHTMSHNTVLVDGIGQAFGGPDAYKTPVLGAILAYKKGGDYVYWMADATNWYPKVPFPVATWKLVFDSNVYGRLAVPHLKMVRRHMLFMRNKYLVVFDDLATAPEHPSRFTWLYHVLQKGKAPYDPKTGRLVYSAGPVKVLLQHIAAPEDLEFQDLEGLGWLGNPITGEDFHNNKHTMQEVVNNPKAAPLIPAHNFWFTTKQPYSTFHFMTVIYPIKPGAEEPKIARLDDWTCEVEADGQKDVISLDPHTRFAATHVVNLAAFREPLGIR